MRLLPILVFSASVGVALAACGGSSEQDVFGSTTSSSTSGSSSGQAASSSSGTTASSSGTTPGTSTSGSSSGGTKDAGVACTREAEPNDEPGDANDLKGSVCGVLTPALELDYLTFTLPAATKSMDLTYEGNIKLRIFVEGEDPVELSPTSNPSVPFKPGKRYILRVSAAAVSTTKIDWRVNLVLG